MTTTEADQAKMIDRVRALLAKAEGTNNPHEAEVFFAKATELMDKYRIDEAAVRVHPVGMVRHTFPMAGFKFLRPSVMLLGAVGRHYGVVVLVASTGNSKYPTLVGEPADIEATVMMFGSLVIQRDRACLSEPVPPGRSPVSFRSSFAIGFAHRVAARLRAMRETAVSAATDSTALEVYGRHEKTMAELGNPSSVKHSKPNIDGHGAQSGDRAARTADLGQDRLATTSTGPRAITAG